LAKLKDSPPQIQSSPCDTTWRTSSSQPNLFSCDLSQYYPLKYTFLVHHPSYMSSPLHCRLFGDSNERRWPVSMQIRR